MKWVESKQQNSTSLPKAAFPAGRPPWAFPRQVPAGHSCWALRRFKPGPPVRGSPVLRALWVGGSGRPAPARPRAGERCGTAYPSGGRGCSEASGRSAPGAPPARQGSPFLPRNGEKEGRGRCPLDPQFYGPLAAARSFWRSCRIVPVMGLFRCPSSYPDLGTFFHKMLFQHIFYSKMRPKSVLAYRRKQPLQRIRDNNRQNERVGTSGP